MTAFKLPEELIGNLEELMAYMYGDGEDWELKLKIFITQALEDQRQGYIAEVEKLFDYKSGKPVPNTISNCVCGYEYDDCSCDHNSAIQSVLDILKGKTK